MRVCGNELGTGLAPLFLEGESILLAVGTALAAGALSSSAIGNGGAAAPKASRSSSFTNCISVGGLVWSERGPLAKVGDWSLQVSEDSL